MRFILILILIFNPLFYGCGEGKEMKRSIEIKEKLLKLKRGTTYEEVIKSFGEPDYVVGSGFVIIDYYFIDNSIVRLNFMGGDMLYGLCEIKPDGTENHIFKIPE